MNGVDWRRILLLTSKLLVVIAEELPDRSRKKPARITVVR